MTTNEGTTESNGTPKKAPRKGSKVAKRIAELESDYAVALAGGSLDESSRIRCCIIRLENGESEEAPASDELPEITVEAPLPEEASDVAATADAKPSWSADVAEAAANAEPEWEWEEAEDIIPVKLTNADYLSLFKANRADQREKDEIDTQIDALKEQMKDKKAEADVILTRIEGRHHDADKGVEQKRAKWKIGTCFALNTVRYVDRETGVVVYERAVEAHERQQSLKLVPEAAPDNVVQLHFGDVEPTDINDPATILADAMDPSVDEEGGL